MNGNSKIKSFTDLDVWKEGHKLVLLIYEVTEIFPTQETFGLISQMKRSSVSITSNVAEGFSRESYKEKVQFYSIAHGSLTELENQLLVAKDVGYIKEDQFVEITSQISSVHKLLNAFIRKTKELSY